MSLLERTAPSTGDSEAKEGTLAHPPAHDLMSEDAVPREKSLPSALTPHDDARALIRLIQCPQCSQPYSSPVTLPCGNSLCRKCVPVSHRRENITYPDLPGRRKAFDCPFEHCASEHAMGDSCVDVTLTKVMEAIADVVAKQASVVHDNISTLLEERGVWHSTGPDQEMPEKPVSRLMSGGRLTATYNLAAQGHLPYKTELTYESISATGDDPHTTDDTVMAQLLEATHKEVDCQVCYSIMLDPVTTACGHTLCRVCLVRTLDHSLHCPVCRRAVLMPPSLHSHPSNKTLVNLLNGLCPEMIVARAEAMAVEEAAVQGELDTPLFVCTLGFPECPTFLRIFEPRYRLMLRRAMEGNRHFGILMYNRHAEPQGELGHVSFMQYGTLLRIENVQFLSDGQSIVETKGVSRFRVKAHGQIDGYAVGNIERVEDISLSEEERLEAEETSLPPVEETDIEGTISRTSTRDLLIQGLEFILRMQARSAPWLHERILHAYGGPPDDAAFFPYWFASILPINDDAKYDLLKTTNVRARLKICAMWIKRMEAQRWYQQNACNVL